MFERFTHAARTAVDIAPETVARLRKAGLVESQRGAAGALAKWGFVLSPAVGAVLMSASTVIVAINAQLLRRARL